MAILFTQRGADQHGPTYSASNSDFAGLSLSGSANSELIDSPVITWNAEDDSSATFDVSFNYDQDRDSATAPLPITGTLEFDKAAGEYEFTMDALVHWKCRRMSRLAREQDTKRMM